MLGRFIWSSLSDRIGRKNTYHVFFLLGAVLYVSIPSIGNMGSIVLFLLCFGIIMSMYGGGLATIPAYLRDRFGTMQVGAIHGRLLLAWSAAALLGPSLVNYIREYQLDSLGIPPAQVYSTTMYIMAGLPPHWLCLQLLGQACGGAVFCREETGWVATTGNGKEGGMGSSPGLAIGFCLVVCGNSAGLGSVADGDEVFEFVWVKAFHYTGQR